jgi:tetratricopeptide (TPR) repeat protein
MARGIFVLGVVLGAGLLLAMPAGAQQEDSSGQTHQDQSQKQAQSQAGNQKKDQKKSTAQENPFPEDKSEAAAKQTQHSEQQGQQDQAPSAPAPQTRPKGSTADRNPFPEEKSEKAAGQNQDQQENAPGAKGSGKDGFSSSQVKGLELPETESRSAGSPLKLPYDPKLAKQDTQVGLFYLQTGDWKGAYDRFAEATKSDPGNADAVYGLGESAAHLGKRDQALSQFRLYLSAVPDGPHARDIRKEMKKMGVEPPK